MAQTPEEATQAVAEATGYVQPPLTADQQAIQDLYSQPLPIGTSQATPQDAAQAVYTQSQLNQSGQVSQTLGSQDDAIAVATNPGVGAGTTNNAATSIGADDNSGTNATTQQIINQSFGVSTNSTIVTQPNVLDRYASYTYAISWYLLTPSQFNSITTGGAAPAFNTASWTLLMQSGGAPIRGRNQYFPVDYYLDDLEIDSFLMGRGTNMSTNGMDIRFKVVEPNGITLIQNLYQAVVAAYKTPQPVGLGSTSTAAGTAGATASATTNTTANQTNSQPPNYAKAQYCLIIEFYGYDAQGNLIAPATGQTVNGSTGQTNSVTSNQQTSSAGGILNSLVGALTGASSTAASSSVANPAASANPTAVIQKYYPFIIQNITFRTVNAAIEYHIQASPVPYVNNTAQSRGTIPFPFSLAGQTVKDILQGATTTVGTSTADPGARTSTATSSPSSPPGAPSDAQTSALYNDGTGLAPSSAGSILDTIGGP